MGQAEGQGAASGGLSRARHKILGSHLPAGLRLDTLNRGPGGSHSTTAPFGDGDGMDTQARGELRAGHVLIRKVGA